MLVWEEQKILLYGDADAQARVKNVAMAATMALDATLDVEARGWACLHSL